MGIEDILFNSIEQISRKEVLKFCDKLRNYETLLRFQDSIYSSDIVSGYKNYLMKKYDLNEENFDECYIEFIDEFKYTLYNNPD